MKTSIFNNKGVLSDSRLSAEVAQEPNYKAKNPGVFESDRKGRKRKLTIDDFVEYEDHTSDAFLAHSWSNYKIPECATEEFDMEWGDSDGQHLKMIWEEMISWGVDFNKLIRVVDTEESGVTVAWPSSNKLFMTVIGKRCRKPITRIFNANKTVMRKISPEIRSIYDWIRNCEILNDYISENVGDHRTRINEKWIETNRKLIEMSGYDVADFKAKMGGRFIVEKHPNMISILDIAKTIVFYCGYHEYKRNGEVYDMFDHIFNDRNQALLKIYKKNSVFFT